MRCVSCPIHRHGVAELYSLQPGIFLASATGASYAFYIQAFAESVDSVNMHIRRIQAACLILLVACLGLLGATAVHCWSSNGTLVRGVIWYVCVRRSIRGEDVLEAFAKLWGGLTE